MKKVCALLLCVALLLVMPTGCKKGKAEKPVELTESTISSDLIRSAPLYAYSHCGQINAMADLKIVTKTEKDNTIDLSVTAQASSNYTAIALAADMKYAYENGHWNMKDVKITKSTPTPTNGLDQESALTEITNYMSVVGKALAVKGETEHSLPRFNPVGGSWELKWEKGATTAQLNVNYKSNALTFKGYYTLTFGDTGWHFETTEKEGSNHLLLHLESLELKVAPQK